MRTSNTKGLITVLVTGMNTSLAFADCRRDPLASSNNNLMMHARQGDAVIQTFMHQDAKFQATEADSVARLKSNDTEQWQASKGDIVAID